MLKYLGKSEVYTNKRAVVPYEKKNNYKEEADGTKIGQKDPKDEGER